MLPEEGKDALYYSFLPNCRTVFILFIITGTLGQGKPQRLHGLCGGLGCGHDVLQAVAVTPLPQARHVDTRAVN